MRSRHSRLFLASLLLVALLPGVGRAVPDELAAELDGAEEQLAHLDARVSLAVEEYNAAATQLARLQEQQLQTEGEVDALAREVDALEDRTASFVRSLYMRGPVSDLSQALYTGEVTEAGRDLAVMDRLSRQRQAELEQLGAQRAALDDARARLATQVAAAREREQELEEHRAAVEQMVADQHDEVVALQDRIAEIEAAEAAEQARREAAAAAEAAEAAAAQAAADAAATPTPSPTSSPSPASPPASPTSSPSPPSPPPPPAPSPSPEPPPPPPEPAPGTRAGADAALQAALSQVGKPYEYAAEGPDSYDCSGLTLWAWQHAGVSLPHSSRMQYAATTRVTRDQLQPGDLVFYGTPIHHVAMYVDGTRVVEAPYTGANVRVREDGLLRSDIVGYGRP